MRKITWRMMFMDFKKRYGHLPEFEKRIATFVPYFQMQVKIFITPGGEIIYNYLTKKYEWIKPCVKVPSGKRPVGHPEKHGRNLRVMQLYWEKYSQAEIGRKLGISRQRVNKIISDCIRRGSSHYFLPVEHDIDEEEEDT